MITHIRSFFNQYILLGSIVPDGMVKLHTAKFRRIDTFYLAVSSWKSTETNELLTGRTVVSRKASISYC